MAEYINFFGKDYEIKYDGKGYFIVFNNTSFKVISTESELYSKFREKDLEYLCLDCSVDFNKHRTFENCLFVHGECSKYRQFNKVLKFINCKFDGALEFIDCEFKTVVLEGNTVEAISFKECHFKKKLKIRNEKKGGYEEQQVSKKKVEKLEIIDCTADDGAYLRIGFLEVDNFVLSNLRLPQDAELNIGDCRFQCFKLTNFRNLGKFKLYKINILKIKDKGIDETKNNKIFQIDNTSIGKTDFQSVNLTSFVSVIMFDNIFTEIDYTNVQWKREIEVRQYGMENGKLGSADIKKRIKNDKVSVCEIVYDRSNSNTEIAKYKMSNSNSDTEIAKKRDTYRTLKNVMIRNNDQREALVFYQKEMEKHWQITKWEKEFGNKVILAVNKYTNNFGLNWWLPIVWLFGFSVAFYCLLLFNLEMPIFALENWQEYFKFLIPIHKAEFITEGCWDFWSYAIDFVFRVLNFLFIYQTIQAFRRYSRRL